MPKWLAVIICIVLAFLAGDAAGRQEEERYESTMATLNMMDQYRRQCNHSSLPKPPQDID